LMPAPGPPPGQSFVLMPAPGPPPGQSFVPMSAPGPPPTHASRPPGSLPLLRGPLPNRPSRRRSVQSSGFARLRMVASFFAILAAAFWTQYLLTTRFFFMAGAMATWQQHRLATDERWGPQRTWIWSPGRRANFEHFELGMGSIHFKVFKVASAGQGRHTNFEHFELGMGSINFTVFKVASPGQCRHTNFENFEVGGGPTSLKVFKVEPGPGIRHDTPGRTSPVP